MPFYLRTGKRMAEGARIISIAFREPPRSMFPPGSGVGDNGPDHLTFDLADQSKMSLSFYGKRPGPGMRLDKLSMQFAMHETGWAGAVLEAYERLIYDAARGDRTLFTSADGIERLWESPRRCSRTRRSCGPTPQGSWGPNRIHQLIAPHAVATAVRAHLARPQRRRRPEPAPWSATGRPARGGPLDVEQQLAQQPDELQPARPGRARPSSRSSLAQWRTTISSVSRSPLGGQLDLPAAAVGRR